MNLRLEIAVLVREKEQGRFIKGSEGAPGEQRKSSERIQGHNNGAMVLTPRTRSGIA